MLELNNSAHHSIQNMAQHSPLLRVYNLVVALFQFAHYLDVLNVHGGQQLKGRQTILQIKIHTYS
jgi:hypothetical protein